MGFRQVRLELELERADHGKRGAGQAVTLIASLGHLLRDRKAAWKRRVDKRGRSRGEFVEQRVWSIYRAAPKCE